MTLKEAIEFQEQYLRQPTTHIAECLDEAIKLGIEALKRLEDLRSRGHPRAFALLPGETKE